MILNGEPFVPPTCPTFREGGDIALTPEKFSFHVDDAAELDGNERTNALGFFFEPERPDDDSAIHSIGTAMVFQDPKDSAFSRAAHRVATKQRRLGEVFCDRVANCRGVIDSECWALGEKAVREVVRQVDEETS